MDPSDGCQRETMSSALDAALAVIDCALADCGLSLALFQRGALLRRLRRRMRLLDLADFGAYTAYLVREPSEAQRLAAALVPAATVPLADAEAIAGLRSVMQTLPAAAGATPRVWVPACDGSPTAALAVLLATAAETGEFLVFASDVVPPSVEGLAALPPVIGERLPAALRRRLLQASGEGLTLIPALQRHLLPLGLSLTAPAPGLLADLILCPDLEALATQPCRQLLARLHTAQRPGGLLWSAVALPPEADDLYRRQTGSMLYRWQPVSATSRCGPPAAAATLVPPPAVTPDPLLGELSEAVVIVDQRGVIREFSRRAWALSGVTRDEALGRPYTQVLQLHTGTGSPDPVADLLAGEHDTAELPDTRIIHRDNRHLALRLRLKRWGNGVLMVFEDVSERNLLAEELAYRVTHDPLTGLLNRDEFDARVRGALAGARHGGKSSTLCIFDVDQFKVINDTLGHVAGDELLHELAAELRGCLGEGDVFARLGGDEFGVLLPQRDLEAARPVADLLIEAARRFRFSWAGQNHAVTISLGAVLVDGATENVAQAISMADAACYVAKDAGRDRARFAGAGDELARRHLQMSLIGKIGKALDESRFTLFYEDVVAVTDPNTVVYRELLLRLREHGGRFLAPAAYIQAAERYFMMSTLDRWVIRRALDTLAQLPPDGVIYAINLSAQSLSDDKTLELVEQELVRSGVSPQRLCFEITETAAVSRMTEAAHFITRLSQMGCRFALDDFGAGMASFSYLKNFAVDFLKIDGGFVRAMLGSRVDRGMVETINRIGHDLGLKTIAEHVESPALLAPLREMGVDWAQGRFIAWSRPVEALLNAPAA
ncbi:MAG: EAL domain-containing protein [Gammaproteobacteria bacterium]|nr:EAL domain-containing protein [Gammaproteobacteria bacterium]